MKAVIDLYRLQQSLRTNAHGHPRGKALREYLGSLKRNEAKRKRDAYQDRGKGTALDGYDRKQLVLISSSLFEEQRAVSLRTRLDILLAHHIVCRGENIRKVQIAFLSDIQSVCIAIRVDCPSTSIAIVTPVHRLALQYSKTNLY